MIYLISPLVMFLWGYVEAQYDKQLFKVLSEDGVTEKELSLLHELQLPLRAFPVILTSVLQVVLISPEKPWILVVVAMLNMIWVWIWVDVCINLFWLKKKWYYIGDTAKTDRKISGKLNWIIKGTLLIGFTVLYFWIR